MANTYEITITAEGAEAAEDEPRAVASWLHHLADRIARGELPERIMDVNGNPRGTVDVATAPMTWAEQLRKLPVITQAQDYDLHVEAQGIRVWLGRMGIEDGHPFAATVHVEELDDDQDEWWDVGYYDGDEPDPTPAGRLGEAFAVTNDCIEEL